MSEENRVAKRLDYLGQFSYRWNGRWQRARKTYTCNQCQGEIKPGELYYKETRPQYDSIWGHWPAFVEYWRCCIRCAPPSEANNKAGRKES